MLGLLYGRQFPSIRTDGAAECPVLFELDRLSVTTGDYRAAVSIDGVIEKISIEPNRDEILTRFGPRLGNLTGAERNVFHAVLLAARV